jgi:hypothetical protein
MSSMAITFVDAFSRRQAIATSRRLRSAGGRWQRPNGSSRVPLADTVDAAAPA